jgi:predicted glycosyltransferase
MRQELFLFLEHAVAKNKRKSSLVSHRLGENIVYGEIMIRNETIKIWIDLENSPHVLFFSPIIDRLLEKNYQVIITARDYAQTFSLADSYSLDYLKVGKHYGSNKYLKVLGGLFRALKLSTIMYREKPDLAISHGSRTQGVVSTLLHHLLVVAIDYEHGYASPVVKPDLILMPNVLCSSEKVKTRRAGKIYGYNGIKEDVYLGNYIPGPFPLREFGIKEDRIIVTVRPPATMAHYHTAKSDELFNLLVHYLGENPQVTIVFLPRTEQQGFELKQKYSPLFDERKALIPPVVVNGPDLIWHSDLVVSGGGTMIREAAALGVPSYSTFGGTIGAVDQYLSKLGRLVLIDKPEDIHEKIDLKKRNLQQGINDQEKTALVEIVDTIEKMIEGRTL